MRKLAILVATAALVARLAGADEPANVAGTWLMTLEVPRGTQTFTYLIAQQGETISLTRTDERGDKLTAAGTVNGTTVQWTLTRETPMGPVTFVYKGTVAGDTMKGTVETPRGTREWTATRSPAT